VRGVGEQLKESFDVGYGRTLAPTLFKGQTRAHGCCEAIGDGDALHLSCVAEEEEIGRMELLCDPPTLLTPFQVGRQLGNLGGWNRRIRL
jgi:hypothetical protein